MIYAIFICIASIGRCNMMPLPLEGYYATKAECLRHLPPQPATDNLRYRCLGRKVEGWH